MKALLIWRDCKLFKERQDGFCVQCPRSEIEEKILPYDLNEHKA